MTVFIIFCKILGIYLPHTVSNWILRNFHHEERYFLANFKIESCVLLKERWSIHKTPICSKCESSECEPDLSFGPLCQLGAQSSEEQATAGCIKIKGVPTVAKATCEDLNWLCLLVNLLEKRNKLTCSSDHLLLYWTAGVVKNVSKGANESFSLLILSSVDIKCECCLSIR